MPTYEYECLHCGRRFGELRAIARRNGMAKCARCGGRGQHVQAPGAGIIFKGSGFYVNDYPKEAKA